MRAFKIARTTETRSTCPYCAVSCGVIIHTLGDKAKNVKVITENGVVTLRGPVKSEEEKAKVEELAKDNAGSARVDSQLEVKKGKRAK